ncbi:MAG: hypothetical protein ACE5SW_06780 [Nitrososphaeraceae archaeon]
MNNNNTRYYFLLLTSVLIVSLINLGSLANPIIFAQDKEKNNNETGNFQSTKNNSIELIAKLVNDTYRWVDLNDQINPSLNILLGEDNNITIKSLSDDPEEHELIIEGISPDGDTDEIIKSEAVEEGSVDTLSFTPEAVEFDSLEYYCEYHPDTMRGNINLINK